MTWDYKDKWDSMSVESQRDFIARLSVMPFKLVLRPWWYKVFVSPVIFWKHYKISRSYVGVSRWYSFKISVIWVLMLLFPVQYFQHLKDD